MRLARILNLLRSPYVWKKVLKPTGNALVEEHFDHDQYEMLIAAAAHHFGEGNVMVAVALDRRPRS
jgi:hypothetical protein